MFNQLIFFTFPSKEQRVLRKILEPKRNEVTGEWRKLHIEELYACTAHQILFG
jgi:hypothetical protein